MNRQLFLATAGAVVAASGVARAADVPGGTDLIERRSDFDEARFAAVAGRTADVRQLWDNAALRPSVLNSIKNALNTLQFGFGYDPARINMVAVNHGASTLYTFSDYLWSKYSSAIFSTCAIRPASASRAMCSSRARALRAPPIPIAYKTRASQRSKHAA